MRAALSSLTGSIADGEQATSVLINMISGVIARYFSLVTSPATPAASEEIPSEAAESFMDSVVRLTCAVAKYIPEERLTN
ncbi:MAG: hypothetical protein LBD16_07560 [Oscillospiraceae bacterium]|jgi:hypothetical protein|nr:hypothetical protein [Oscillospiraceae bacterium]